MIFTELSIFGAWHLAQERRADDRGFFARVWCEQEFRSRGLIGQVAQANTGFSPTAGTLRGLHYQVAPHLEAKVVRCLRGRVFDVIADLRRDSPSFKRWVGVELNEDNGESVYVPAGCAHGYLTLEPNCEVMYFATAAYAPNASRGVRFDDPAFSIDWPRPVEVISEADRRWPDFAQQT